MDPGRLRGFRIVGAGRIPLLTSRADGAFPSTFDLALATGDAYSKGAFALYTSDGLRGGALL